jgi:hypothetical protein
MVLFVMVVALFSLEVLFLQLEVA